MAMAMATVEVQRVPGAIELHHDDGSIELVKPGGSAYGKTYDEWFAQPFGLIPITLPADAVSPEPYPAQVDHAI